MTLTMVNYHEGIADELGIQYGDFVTITRGSRVIQGTVTDISEDGDSIELAGFTPGHLIDLEGADVSID